MLACYNLESAVPPCPELHFPQFQLPVVNPSLHIHYMQNPRNKQFLSFKLHTIPSSVMKSHAAQHTPTWVVLSVKNPPAMQEAWVPSLGQEDSLEKEMATHPSIPAWKIPWTEEPAGLQFMESQRLRYNWACMHAWRKEKWKVRDKGKDTPNCMQSSRE